MTTAPPSTSPSARSSARPSKSQGRTRQGTPGLLRMIITEFAVFNRDFGSIFFVVAFPAILLLGMGYAIPGLRDPITDAPEPWLGLDGVHLMAPVMVAVAIAMAGFSSLPTYLAGYRENGILRRLSTTPMAPRGVLIAQVVVNFVWLTVGSALAVVAGMALLDVPQPDSWALVTLTFPLAVTSVFGIGLIIGGLIRKASVAGGIGMVIFFPMMFFAGLWTPGPAMPDTMATIATWTPLGAAGQAFTTAWYADTGFPTLQFISMALWTVVTFTIASKTFRWR